MDINDDERELADLAKRVLAMPHKERAESKFGKSRTKAGAKTGSKKKRGQRKILKAEKHDS